MRAIGAGLRADALRGEYGARWPVAQNATFSLLGRRYLTIVAPSPSHARAWAPLLDRPTVD
jgi:hypothetical protein